MLVWNFLTFLIYQKPKFWREEKSDFLPQPPSEGGTKKMKILKGGRRAKVANKAKSKRWALYLENWASYDTFRVATWGENLYQTRFSNLKISVSFWDLGPIFCKWAQFLDRSNFYIATWGLTQLLHWFLRGDWFSPPPSNPQNLYPLPGRVKQLAETGGLVPCYFDYDILRCKK